jgi:hypothetical protein
LFKVLFHTESVKRICFPGLTITNYSAVEKELLWRIFFSNVLESYALEFLIGQLFPRISSLAERKLNLKGSPAWR